MSLSLSLYIYIYLVLATFKAMSLAVLLPGALRVSPLALLEQVRERLSMHTCIHSVYIYIYIYIYTHMNKDTHTYIYIYIYIYIYAHIHIVRERRRRDHRQWHLRHLIGLLDQVSEQGRELGHLASHLEAGAVACAQPHLVGLIITFRNFYMILCDVLLL